MQDDLDRAQERLGRTLERARASEDRELAGRVRDEGSQLVHQLNGLLRMCRLHDLENRAFEKPLRDLAHSLQGLIALLGTLTLALVDDQVYLNEIRIRLDEQQGGAELGAELLRHGLGGLRFYVAATEQELRRLVACFAEKPDAQAPRAALRAALQREGLEGIELLGRFRVRAAGAPGALDGADAAKRCALAVIDVFDNLGRGRLFNPLPARRAVAELVARGREHEGLTDDPSGCRPHVAHALRVCRLALLLGREVGLPHGLLQDLGVAALLHDVGYAESDRTSGGRAPGFDRHPAAGARLLLRQRGFHISKVRRVRAVLGHHAAAGGRRRPPALLARLLHVAEDYDTLVRRSGLSPREALSRMMGAAGTVYDPVLIQAFVNLLGASLGLPGVKVASALAAPFPPLELADLAELPELPELAELNELTLVEPEPARIAPTPSAPAPAPVSRARPSLEGPLSQGVPIRLIHDAHLERRTGHLVFEGEAERCDLHFKDGDVVAVSSSRPDHCLGALLASGGLVSPAQLEGATAEAARSGRPLGRTLVSHGDLEAEFLEQALAAQARVLVSNLVEWETGLYRFFPDAGPQPEEDEGHSISTDGLIVGAVRALHDPDVVRFALGDLGRVPRRSADPARHAAEAILGPAEQALLGRVDGSTSARVLVKEAGLPAEECARALLTLLALGLVDYPPS